MFMTDKLLNDIRVLLTFIALTLLVYVSYEIYHAEKAKETLREATQQITNEMLKNKKLPLYDYDD